MQQNRNLTPTMVEQGEEQIVEEVREEHSSKLVHFLAGGLGGCAGSIVTQPLDTLKTRLQSSKKVSSIVKGQQEKFFQKTFSSLRYTYVNEGVHGLFRGMVPNLIGIVPSRSIYFGAYTNTKDYLVKHFHPSKQEEESAWIHILSAAVAGVAVTSVMNPIFLLKTRIQLQETSANNYYNGYFDCIKKIYKEEGFRAFYRGLTASWLGIAENALYFVVYEKLKYLSIQEKYQEYLSRQRQNDQQQVLSMNQFTKQENFSPFLFLTISAFCKLFASAVTYPHEVLRTRMREHNGESGLVNCTKNIWRQEGWRGFYAGMGAHLMRVVPNTAIMFTVYELTVKFYESKNK